MDAPGAAPVKLGIETAPPRPSVDELLAALNEVGLRLRELDALEAITEVGLAFLDLDLLLDQLLDRFVALTGAEVAIIYLLRDRGLVPRRVRGVLPTDIGKLGLRPGEGAAGRAVDEGQAIFVPDARKESWSLTPYAREHGFRSILAVPLRARGKIIGAIEIDYLEPRRLQRHEVSLLEVLAERAAMAIENARLISELRERTEELEREREQRERFMAMVVHDLRGPVTALRGYTHFLRRYDQLPPERRAQTVQAIEDETRRLERLLADLMDVSLIAAGRFTIARANVDLVQLVKQVVEAQQHTTEKHRLILEAPDRLEGQWDATRLAQAVTNLVSNAIKYSPEGGEVRVRLRRADGQVELCVSDQGIGLAPEELETIFVPFARAERARRLAGAGLGLYITKGIVEAHGGRIWAESPGPGKGSTFCFAIPEGQKESGTRDRAVQQAPLSLP